MNVGDTQAHHYAIYVLAGFTGFVCGAYLQQEVSIRNLFCLIRSDPNVFQQRHKLYPLLSTFKTDHESRLWNRQPSLRDKLRDCLVTPLCEAFNFMFMIKPYEPLNSTNLLELIKYGLPSGENLVVHRDFVMSLDANSNTALWVCEHLKSKCDPRELPQLHFNDVCALSSTAEPPCKVFKSQLWHELERHVTEMTAKFGSVYTYTGPIYLPSFRKSEGWSLNYHIVDWLPVPEASHYFKVLVIDSVQPGCQPYMEGYIIPNRGYCGFKDLRECLSDIDEIERYTGLTFAKGMRHNVLYANNTEQDDCDMQSGQGPQGYGNDTIKTLSS